MKIVRKFISSCYSGSFFLSDALLKKWFENIFYLLEIMFLITQLKQVLHSFIRKIIWKQVILKVFNDLTFLKSRLLAIVFAKNIA